MTARCTRITATTPAIVTKWFSMGPDGTLRKETSANVVAGRMEVVEFEGLSGFKQLLTRLTTDQALAYGVPIEHPVDLVTQDAWEKAGQPKGQLPRTKEAVPFAAAPGVLMLDYDPPKGDGAALSKDELVAALRAAVPGLDQAPMLWWPSSGSHICDGERDLTGLRGQRLYLLVSDATDIPRAGAAIAVYLWAQGHGHFAISSSGSLLERALFDTSVWQSNRIDFAAGAHCVPPLTQRRGEPVLIAGTGAKIIDTRIAIPEPSAEVLSTAESNRAAARVAAEPERTRVRADYVERRAGELVDQLPASKRGSSTRDDLLVQARKQVDRALDGGELFGDWLLTLADGEVVSVADALDNPGRYHGRQTLDPIEPEYDGGRPVGKLYLYGRPRLHSFAHGGRTFRLLRQTREIELEAGNSRRAADEVLALMRATPEFFDFGDALATVDERGGIAVCTVATLRYHLGGIVRFFVWKPQRNGPPVKAFVDAPEILLRSLIELGRQRGIRSLRGVITAPTLRPDGSVLCAPGFDEQTGLLMLSAQALPSIPDRPRLEQCGAALDTLWEPFSKFLFVGPVDRAVHLAALLTACVRAALPTAPAIGYDAPVQGSGKTLLAKCVGALASETLPAIWPHVGMQGDEEVRKRLFAALREGVAVLIWDNVTGQFDSASLAAFLTSERYRDRELGRSQTVELPNAATFIMTGNNLRVAGDLSRRVMLARIDPKSDRPIERHFAFDPLNRVIARRQSMVAAALTLIRGWLSAQASPMGAALASFEAWDRMVRQTVAWVAHSVAPAGMFADPVEAVTVSVVSDPEAELLAQLLDAWEQVYGTDRCIRAQELASLYEQVQRSVYSTNLSTEPARALIDALSAMLGGKRASAVVIGRALGYRKDRRYNGRWLENRANRNGVSEWRLCSESCGGCGGLQGSILVGQGTEQEVHSMGRGRKVPPQPPASPAVGHSWDPCVDSDVDLSILE